MYLVFTSRKKEKNRKKYCDRHIIPACTVMHKILRKKHASMLIMQQLQILIVYKIM